MKIEPRSEAKVALAKVCFPWMGIRSALRVYLEELQMEAVPCLSPGRSQASLCQAWDKLRTNLGNGLRPDLTKFQKPSRSLTRKCVCVLKYLQT